MKKKMNFKQANTGGGSVGEKTQNTQGRIHEEDLRQQRQRLAKPGTHLEKNKL